MSTTGPKSYSVSDAPKSDMDRVARLLDTYRVMRLARSVDEVELDLVRRGEAFFHVSCGGHEGLAILAHHLIDEDWLCLHYRDKALVLARGVSPETFFDNLLCNAASQSAGRQMSAHFCNPALHIVSLAGPVGNNALHAVGIASVVKDDPAQPIVVCSVGDGTTQQGEFLEAVGEAVRSKLPVLFLVEDNGLAISTRTRAKTFYSLPAGYEQPETFFGIAIHRLDGSRPHKCEEAIELVVAEVRERRQPAIVIFQVERLSSHTHADDQSIYRSEHEIRKACESSDPIRNLFEHLQAFGVAHSALRIIDEQAATEAQAAAERAIQKAGPEPTTEAKSTLPAHLTDGADEYRGTDCEPRLTMLQAIRKVLHRHLELDPRVTLLGEDIEDPKGDVFGVTRGLTAAFPGRVKNSSLAESTIIGVSIGRSLAGARPVAFIQMADFLPLAFNQILTEMGSIYWRTNGQCHCPVIVMVACGAYRPGLGPFHSQTLESVLAHVPGIDVLMPSNAADAAGLLNAAFDSGRPTVFLYPKACLNDREHTTSSDVERHLVPLGRARVVTAGNEMTIVAWGNTVPLCEMAANALEMAGKGVEVVDLRSISPWDARTVIASAKKTRRLLVVHEDNLTCGFGAEVVAAVSEAVPGLEQTCRVTRPDTYIPCNFNNQLDILPSFRRILSTAAEMLGLEACWRAPAVSASATSLLVVEAPGASPADETVKVLAWKVSSGQRVVANEPLAELESDKAVYNLTSPDEGVIEDILVPETESVKVGTPLLRLRPTQLTRAKRQLMREEPAQLTILRVRETSARLLEKQPLIADVRIGISSAYCAVGSSACRNDDLLSAFPSRTPQDIIQRTGIESRWWAAPDETPLSMAIDAAKRALAGESLNIRDLDAIICSTTTPLAATPSLACQIHHHLCGKNGVSHDVPCYDILAACSGYLYALSAAYDFIHTRRDANVLVITAEVLSRAIDHADFDTAILFGDAASATVVYGPTSHDRMKAILHRPVVSARGEDSDVLTVPLIGQGHLVMQGKRVFSEAVRGMLAVLGRACAEARIPIEELDLVVPHQANGRIIEALRERLKFAPERVVNCIRHVGNTSSSSIPLALSLLNSQMLNGKIGLCAFGGGFTFAAAILEPVVPGATE